MKILHTVEFYDPSIGGAQEVVKQLSEHMVNLGHDVTVATTKLPSRKERIINGVKIAEFDVSGNQVRGYLGKDVEKYKQFLIGRKFDVVMNYAAQQWTSDLTFEVIDQIQSKKIFVPCGYSGLYDPLYINYFDAMPSILAKYHKVVYLSNDYRDINFARKHKLKNSIVIPNGADEREFENLPKINKESFLKRFGIPSHNKILLCVSNHTGQKGHKEAIESFKKAKIKDASLVFIGDVNINAGCYRACKKASNMSKIWNSIVRNGKTIHTLTLSRNDTINFYSISDIFIFLSNIECSPLVLFESAAAGLPFIASNCGNSVEIAKWLGNGIIAKSKQTKEGFTSVETKSVAVQIEKILISKKKMEIKSKAARTKWKSKYTWNKISQDYLKIYLNR